MWSGDLEHGQQGHANPPRPALGGHLAVCPGRGAEREQNVTGASVQ